MVGDNVVYAWWPKFFRVVVFRSDPAGGFKDAGSYPLETPRVDNNQTWRWLLDQLVSMDIISEAESRRCGVEMSAGRTIVLTEPSGKKFMLLLPS